MKRPFVAAVGVALCVVAVVWISLILRKTAPGYWDEGIYYASASRLRGALLTLDAGRFLELLVADARRPPLLALLAAPAESFRAAMLVNAAAWLLLGFSVARLAGGALAAAIALWACVSAPLLFGLSRLFLVEFALAAVLAALLALTASARVPAVRLGLLLGAGCLLKPLFALYAAAPLIWLWRSRPKNGRKRDALRLLAVAAVVAGPWYALNGLEAARWAWSAGFGTVAADFAGPQWRLLLYDVGWWHVAAAVCVLGVRPRGVEALALVTALAPLPVFLLGDNKETRYLAPLLPAAAIWLGAAGARALARGPWAWLVLLAWFGVSGGGLLSQAFALEGTAPAGYNLPPDERANWDLQGVVERLRPRAKRVAVASVSQHFHHQSLAALAVRRGAPLRFSPLAYPQGPEFDVEAALARLRALDADCALFLDGAPASDYPPFFNRATPQLRARFETGREPWKRRVTAPVAPTIRAVAFCR